MKKIILWIAAIAAITTISFSCTKEKTPAGTAGGEVVMYDSLTAYVGQARTLTFMVSGPDDFGLEFDKDDIELLEVRRIPDKGAVLVQMDIVAKAVPSCSVSITKGGKVTDKVDFKTVLPVLKPNIRYCFLSNNNRVDGERIEFRAYKENDIEIPMSETYEDMYIYYPVFREVFAFDLKFSDELKEKGLSFDVKTGTLTCTEEIKEYELLTKSLQFEFLDGTLGCPSGYFDLEMAVGAQVPCYFNISFTGDNGAADEIFLDEESFPADKSISVSYKLLPDPYVFEWTIHEIAHKDGNWTFSNSNGGKPCFFTYNAEDAYNILKNGELTVSLNSAFIKKGIYTIALDGKVYETDDICKFAIFKGIKKEDVKCKYADSNIIAVDFNITLDVVEKGDWKGPVVKSASFMKESPNSGYVSLNLDRCKGREFFYDVTFESCQADIQDSEAKWRTESFSGKVEDTNNALSINARSPFLENVAEPYIRNLKVKIGYKGEYMETVIDE